MRALSGGPVRWATCALTQLGFIRLSSDPAAIRTAKSQSEAAGVLARLAADSMHVYLGRLPAPTSGDWRSSFDGLLGHQQVMDAYLLKLAAANDATFVTFDRRLESAGAGRTRVVVLG